MEKEVFLDSDEEFLILTSLIHSAPVPPEQERFKSPCDAFRDRADFPEWFDNGVLDNLCGFVDPVDDIPARQIQAFYLNVQGLTGFGDHCLDAAKLISCGSGDFNQVRGGLT